jgi:hypothetical protein
MTCTSGILNFKFEPMSIPEFIAHLPGERQAPMLAIHKIIIAHDKTIVAAIEPMMGKAMILYKEGAIMKYGLSSVKQHISLHCMPIYGNPSLHARYEALMPGVKFQKGCINFTNAQIIPLDIVTRLIDDCAGVSLREILEKLKKTK